MDFKGMSMSELIAQHNILAAAKGVASQNEFKNLAAARAAITKLEGTNMTEETQVQESSTETVSDPSKYSTVGKRGPNQGIGEFAKQLLVDGMATSDVLLRVREQFPTAKTSASCIAYYKAALKNPNLGKRKASVDPEALRAKAAQLLADADAAEQAAAQQAAAEPADTPADAE
jgi:hypothetical protein